MASIRSLKREMNDVFGTIIEGAMLWQHEHPSKDHGAAEAIVDDCIDAFDDLISRVNDRTVDSRNSHLKAVRADFSDKAREMVSRLNSLD